MKMISVYALAIVTGILPAFFIVFNSVFSDSSGALGERLFTFLLTAAAYGILGFLFGYFSPSSSVRSGIALSAPAVLILILYTFKEPQTALLSIAYLVVTVITACAASSLGAYFRTSNRKR